MVALWVLTRLVIQRHGGQVSNRMLRRTDSPPVERVVIQHHQIRCAPGFSPKSEEQAHVSRPLRLAQHPDRPLIGIEDAPRGHVVHEVRRAGGPPVSPQGVVFIVENGQLGDRPGCGGRAGLEDLEEARGDRRPELDLDDTSEGGGDVGGPRLSGGVWVRGD